MTARRVVLAIAGVTVVLALGVTAAVLLSTTGSVPSFPSLEQTPDPALHGTVAYLGDGNCIRIIAAGGGPSRQVLCLPDQDVAVAEKLGKEQGPQLVWRPDGRLEVTMFRMTDPPGPGFEPGWQKVVDVRTGAVEDVPAAAVPSIPDSTTQPATTPTRQRHTWTSDPASRPNRVLLREDGNTRTLLAADGPGEGTYRLLAAFWSPDGNWIAADDGRILVITPADAVTRVLVTPADSGFQGDGLARFAITGADLLGPTA